jgi:hypothetical protein
MHALTPCCNKGDLNVPQLSCGDANTESPAGAAEWHHAVVGAHCAAASHLPDACACCQQWRQRLARTVSIQEVTAAVQVQLGAVQHGSSTTSATRVTVIPVKNRHNKVDLKALGQPPTVHPVRHNCNAA